MPRPHVLVAVERLDLAHVVFHEAPQHLPLGQKERDAGARIRREREQLEVLADLAVVPRPGLLESPQIRLEFLLRRPGRTVDAGEHRVLLVAAPVGPRYVLQLEGAEPARARDVRAAAEVEEISLFVDRDLTVLQPLQDLGLVGVALVERLGLGFGDLLALYRKVLRDDLAHPLLDARQIIVRKTPVDLDIVEEAVLYRRAEGQLAARIQLHYRLRHRMRRRVPQDLKAPRGVFRNHLEIPPAVKRGIEVDELSIQLRHDRVSGEAFTYLLGDLAGFRARFDL